MVPRPGFKPRPSALGGQSVSHCTTREVPGRVSRRGMGLDELGEAVSSQGSLSGKEGDRRTGEELWGWKQRLERCHCWLWSWRKGPPPRRAGGSRSSDKRRKRFSPRTSRRNAAQLSLALAQPRDLWEVTQLPPVSVARL